MAKAKNTTETETETKHAGTPFAYKVVKRVRVGTLKVEDGGEVFVRILSAIETKASPVKGDDGVMRMKDIDVVRVTDLTDGVEKEMVVAVVLSKTLKDFDGGNGKYVGLCFRIQKQPKVEGKRFKNYEVDQIEDPEQPA